MSLTVALNVVHLCLAGLHLDNVLPASVAGQAALLL